MRLATLATAITTLATASAANADGGSVRAAERVGSHAVTVFAAPNPPRAGPIDVSVLVQDAESGRPVEIDSIPIRLVSQSGPPASVSATATRAAATNKLLCAAKLDVPRSGRWRVGVQVGEAGREIQFTLDAGEALPKWRSLWPWFAWPILPIAGFLALSRRRRPPLARQAVTRRSASWGE